MWTKLLFHALLFAVFVPGVLVTLPPDGSRTTVLVVHSLLFALLSHYVWRMVFPRH
jgi:cell division protein FtsW (lipid II flippase)